MNTFLHTSIADIREESLVDELLSDTYWRDSLSNIHGIDDNPMALPQVPLTGLAKGDIDILFVAPGRARTPTAIQVKRIKVSAKALRTQQPNGFGDLEKGKRQANLLACLGFWQVYLYVFVVVDAREQNIKEIASGEPSYRGMVQPLKSIISQEMSPLGLDQRVGLMHWEFEQTMDHKALTTGVYGGSLLRLASPQPQRDQITDWVSKLGV